jgi:hypothetical protein
MHCLNLQGQDIFPNAKTLNWKQEAKIYQKKVKDIGKDPNS